MNELAPRDGRFHAAARLMRSGSAWYGALAVCLAVFGCSDSVDPDPSSSAPTEVLAPLSHLLANSPANDPLAEHRPEHEDCNTLTGWFIEAIDGDSAVLEVNTGECNYLSVSEAAVTSAEPGDTLLTELSYFDLTAPEPSEAHVALLIDDQIIWEKSIAIPSKADVLELEITVRETVSVGDKIGFHLHNHGQNSWNFTPVRVRRQVAR